MSTVSKTRVPMGGRFSLRDVDTSSIVINDRLPIFHTTTAPPGTLVRSLIPTQCDLFDAAAVLDANGVVTFGEGGLVHVTPITRFVETKRATNEILDRVIDVYVHTCRATNSREDISRSLQFFYPNLIGTLYFECGPTRPPAEAQQLEEGNSEFEWSKSLYRGMKAASEFGSQTHGDY